MIALLQRVAQAGVTVDGETVGEVGRGLCVLVCAVKGDTEEKARALAQKVLRYRIFEDDAGKMNRSVSCVAIYACCRHQPRQPSELYARGCSRRRKATL